ncbi:GH1 family beta-glucosidase [Pontiella sulfatireligans]|uniref:Beta-glucosidase n=1 Tax=Pontiella sulfatireligans TaxID=2750658 RepID=A0A6C2UIV8_9BACT|nr:GH1 family beta-glucosidase [Pontiella sulfatireligans]VGO19254.1 Beta-glucosidase A [Pontiella sulfatireligans]
MNNQFPENFVWGAATASYQVEGAVREGGRAPSIWDAMCQTPGKIMNGDTGDVACDHYHRIEEDVKLMKDIGLTAYRFSIAWPRIQPDGQGEANPAGIAFYNRLIDCLLENGIQPWVTLYHWDLPLALQIEHDGWLNRDIVDRFSVYARICFENFGDRVKNWITLNEPWCSAVLGHGCGVHAPGRVSNTEPYIAAHHLILSHAKAVEIYRSEFSGQHGMIGLVNNCDYRYPLTESDADKAAAERSMEFFLAWFADPVWKGDYPAVMRERVGDRLPIFSDEERTMVLGSSDFFGLNHYTTMLASEPNEKPHDASVAGNGGIFDDQHVRLDVDPTWEQTHMGWSIVPEGCRELLKWIDARYGHPIIYITENGCALDEPDHDTGINDTARVDFHDRYLRECRNAIGQGVDLRGYFTWSLMDNFEWSFGYGRRFGLVRIDYETLERTPKLSARWYHDAIALNGESISLK